MAVYALLSTRSRMNEEEMFVYLLAEDAKLIQF
jgi:hypothetical protein